MPFDQQPHFWSSFYVRPKTLEHFQDFLDFLGLHSLPKLVLPSSMSLSTIYTPVTLKSDL